MVAPCDTDVQVALSPGWQWRRPPGGQQLLVPPEDSYFYFPNDDGIQLVPAYSTDPDAWKEYLAELREGARVSIQVVGKRVSVFVDDQPFRAPTVPQPLLPAVLASA